MALTPITVTGSFVKADGTASAVSGSFTLNKRIQNGTTIVEPTPIPVTANSSGQLVNLGLTALILDACDDVGTVPAGAAYYVQLTVDGAPLEPFECVISHSAVGGTVDISTLMPVLP